MGSMSLRWGYSKIKQTVFGRMKEVRTREKSYSDYGIGMSEIKELKRYCRSMDFDEHKRLLDSAISANPYIAAELYFSIVTGVSYDELSKVRYIPLPKTDFYGYQRSCLSDFRNQLRLCGKW